MSNIFDITIDQFATWKFQFSIQSASVSASETVLTPVPLISWSFTGSIRETFTSGDPPAATMSLVIADSASSTIVASLLPEQTAVLTKKKYVYDIIATNLLPEPIEIYRILEGKITVNPGVTQIDADH